jgi:predicted AAA+ superfamily ATPase
LASKQCLLKDIAASAENFSINSLYTYLNALERLFVLEDVEAWCPSIRSATTIRAGQKREFVDPSIAIAALGLTPDYLKQDLKTFGFLFECLCIRDLKIYSQAFHGRVSYYHDRYNLEADAVLTLEDGRYALIEFKLGSSEIELGASHLLKIKELVKEYNQREPQHPLREPDLLMIITGGNMAITRPDGIKIVPIGCLRD